MKKLEQNIYSAVLDKILDDKKITKNEKTIIKHLETVIKLDVEFKDSTKKEIFRLFYLDIIADHQITDEEYKNLKNIISGLDLDEVAIREELKVVQEIIRMQKLKLPLTSLDTVSIKLQKNETPYYSSQGKVLSRKKAPKNAKSEYEFTIRRNGEFVITDKRVLVVNEGITKVNLNEIIDIDVDLDNSMIVISKGTSSTPTFIESDEPLYAAKIIDLLTEQ